MYMEKVLDLSVQLVKNGGKNKSAVCVYKHVKNLTLVNSIFFLFCLMMLMVQ